MQACKECGCFVTKGMALIHADIHARNSIPSDYFNEDDWLLVHFIEED